MLPSLSLAIAAMSGITRHIKIAAASLAVAALVGGGYAPARAAEPSRAEPIKIGLGMSLTGPLAANGKSALLAMQIWAADVNAKGGLLGRSRTDRARPKVDSRRSSRIT